MFCPLCHAEYREGFHRCTDCDVALVNALPEKPGGEDSAAELEGGLVAMLWRGSDPVVYTAILNALGEAKIPYLDTIGHNTKDVPVSPFPSAYDSGAGFAIRVYRVDLPAAERILEEALEQEPKDYPFRAEVGGAAESAGAPEGEIPQDWEPGQAIAEVWSGEDEEMAQILSDCLRENGIGSRVTSDTTPHRLRVHPQDEGRAREIIREVVEGAPPA